IIQARIIMVVSPVSLILEFVMLTKRILRGFMVISNVFFSYIVVETRPICRSCGSLSFPIRYLTRGYSLHSTTSIRNQKSSIFAPRYHLPDLWPSAESAGDSLYASTLLRDPIPQTATIWEYAGKSLCA